MTSTQIGMHLLCICGSLCVFPKAQNLTCPMQRGIAILGVWVDTSGGGVGTTAGRPPARPHRAQGGPRAQPALAWLACLLCLALAWSGLGLSCLPCQQQQRRRSRRRPPKAAGCCCWQGIQDRPMPDQVKAMHDNQASQAKAAMFDQHLDVVFRPSFVAIQKRFHPETIFFPRSPSDAIWKRCWGSRSGDHRPLRPEPPRPLAP